MHASHQMSTLAVIDSLTTPCALTWLLQTAEMLTGFCPSLDGPHLANQPQSRQSTVFTNYYESIQAHTALPMTKPVLYTFGASVWSAVPEVAFRELGYGPNDIELKTINLLQGENFSPAFLKINPKATLPTLTVGDKAYTSTEEVVDYLIDNAPKPVKKATGSEKDIIARIHQDDIDPNFALLLSRSDEEKKARADGIVLAFLSGRQNALEKHAVTPEAAEFSDFYKAKIEGNGGLLSVYADKAPEDAKQKFYETSKQHWENLRDFILNVLPGYLPNSGFVAGAAPGEVDFHLGAWLTRIIATTGAKDVSELAAELKQPVPTKVASYWKAWSDRDSWKTVYAEGLH
ncbi:hypothetical protein A7U60_g6695 [Sanghuangporus baumii]|uniref:GST N-terminal domain-containing protein n=1 Tax=Sanghuangporus baumii TaxID=108892 RepID=A0A9Q5HU94_SANBA|nr:hypothetical protein A7U60_g6695 [Sanghuangporus baumii]